MASSFDQTPDDYDRVRPGYPEKLVQDMIELTGLPDGGDVLEVGCGTGQATAPMIDRGYRMTCLDIGDNLLDIARQKFNEADARFINVSFEDWAQDRAYDLVMSATAWHWINKDIGYMKAAQVLSTDGGIALFWNKHPTPYSGFFEDVQVLYDEAIPRGEKQVQSTEDWIKEQKQAIQDSSYFNQVKVREYPWSIRFSRDQYISLLNTYSDHINLPRNKKKRLYTGIAEIIDSDYNGFVDRPYLSVLFTAKKIN